MTMSNALPDPDRQAEFYSSIPAKRLFAWMIDVLLVGMTTFLLGIFTLGIAWLLFPLFYLVIDFTYRWMTISAGSATLGMRLMAIELRNWSGQRLDRQEAALHTGAFLVCAAFALPQFISMLMMAFGPRRQGLHDLFLGTAAINRPG